MRLYIHTHGCDFKRLRNEGITLIALVVTIIVLFILAGVSLNLIAGSDGILAKATSAVNKTEIARAKEEVELEIANLRIEKKEKIVSEDFSQMDNNEIHIINAIDFPVQVTYKNYKFEIDEKFNVTYVEKFSFKIKARNKWNLGEENSELETYQGTPDYKGASEGVYLYNSVLASKENYILNDTFTIIIETKNIEQYGCGFMVGTGQGGSGIGGQFFGITRWIDGSYAACSGAGDSYGISGIVADLYPQDQWNISAIKYDGREFAYFVNGQKMGTSTSTNIKNSKLYIGGISNSGTVSAAVYWGYGNGYYRNLAIYDEALSDEDLENYSF